MSDIEVRYLDVEDIEIREESDNARTITGLAVPWDEVVDTRDLTGKAIKETFTRGAFGDVASVPLFFNHGHQRHEAPIGLVTRGEETDEGFKITARISPTVRGDETYTLLRDGVIKSMSVGFSDTPGGTRLEKGVHVRSSVKLREVSVVPFPAYAGATISEVRSENPTTEKEGSMPDIDYAPKADLIEVRESVEDLSRQFATLNTGGSSNDAGIQVRSQSFGEFVKGLQTGDAKEDAEILHKAAVSGELYERAWSPAGNVVADNAAQAPTWMANAFRLVEANRRIFNLFDKEPLPSEGMTINRPVRAVTTTGNVAEQAAQGDDLTLLKLSTTNENFPVKTYGGYSRLSKQAIERTDAAYLNAVLRFQLLDYARQTNSVVATALTTSPASYNQLTLGALSTQDKAKTWTDAVYDAAAAIADNSLGLSADVWLVSSVIFKKIASVYDAATYGRPVFSVFGDGVNNIGSVDLLGRVLNVAGLLVYPDPNLTGTDTFVCSREAITILESPGAPFRLQDQNIINLSEDFSIYGYLATVKNDLKGITRVIVPAA
jgi:HK97 family phage prohead protease